MPEKVTILSDGLRLAAVLHVPEGITRPLPAVIVTHGFGGNKDGKTHLHLHRSRRQPRRRGCLDGWLG